jgi:hypothetical protein
MKSANMKSVSVAASPLFRLGGVWLVKRVAINEILFESASYIKFKSV